jgi:divalent metal cation (Fe/Co/Zn/Cd) transporter
MTVAGLTIHQLLRLCAGLIVWASAFVMLYAGFSLGCQQLDIPIEDGLLNPVTGLLAGVAIVHAVILVFLIRRWHQHPVKASEGESDRSRHFLHRVEGLVLWVSLFALVWIAFPVFMLPPCAG